MKSSGSFAVLPLLLLAGCVSVPSGPGVMALPGAGKSFDQFRADDAECRRYAQYQIGGGDASQAAVDAGVRSAAVGTLVGAVAGAAIGGRDGAGVGAGTGLLMGSMAGSGTAQSSAYGAQRSYDNAYIQCMYAKGEQVPVPHTVSRGPAQAPLSGVGTPPEPSYPPPPAPPQYWYYCANPAGYYPYVSQCAAGWQKVEAKLPPAAPPR